MSVPEPDRGPAMEITIHWSAGGSTVVRSNYATAREAVDIVRAGDVLTLLSDPGEPLWLVAAAPGTVDGIAAVLADPSQTVVVGRLLVERASVPLDMVRELFAGALEGQAAAVMAALAQALPAVAAQQPDMIRALLRLVDILTGAPPAPEPEG